MGPKTARYEICNFMINHDGNVPYWERQFYDVIPLVGIPSLMAWFYSIASSSYGDVFLRNDC